MRRLIFLLLIIVYCTPVRAQQHFPTPAENPFWTLEHGQLFQYDCTPGCGYYTTCMLPVYYKSDTVINTVTYHRLYTRSICHSVLTSPSPYCTFSCDFNLAEELYAIILIDTAANTVSQYSEFDGGAHLLFDFNLSVGQLYPPTFNNPYITSSDSLMVVSEDSIFLGNSYYKKWNLGIKSAGTIHDSAYVAIIEGIGSTFGLLGELYVPFETLDALVCFSINDSVLYPDSTAVCDRTVDIPEMPAEDAFELYPNPAGSNIQLNLIYQQTETPVAIYNAQGQKISEQIVSGTVPVIDVSFLQPGLYFFRIDVGRNAGMKGFLKE